MPPKLQGDGQGARPQEQGSSQTQIDVEQLIAATTRAVLSSVGGFNTEKLNYADIGSQIPIYGDKEDEDVEVWINRVDEIKQAFDLSEKVVKVIATKQLRGKVRDWYSCTPGMVQKTWSELKIDMKRMFASYESHISLMKKMENRRWKAGETFSNYFYDKVKLTNKLSLPEQDTVDYIIQGIDNYVLRPHALAAKYKTTAEVLESLKLMSEDKVCRGSRDSKEQPKKLASPAESKAKTPQPTVRCYNCNEQGHIASNCMKEARPRGSCYKCGEVGHTSRTCTKEVKPEGPTSTTTLVVNESRNISKYHFTIMINNVKFKCLLDSGSVISIVKESYYKKYLDNYKLVPEEGTMSFNGINGSKLEILGYENCVLYLQGDMGKGLFCKLAVTPDHSIPCSIILGQNFVYARYVMHLS